jgi:formate hydrogenlyase subunit 6/NADH:ubiquinone oxidoreductase subunit I
MKNLFHILREILFSTYPTFIIFFVHSFLLFITKHTKDTKNYTMKRVREKNKFEFSIKNNRNSNFSKLILIFLCVLCDLCGL